MHKYFRDDENEPVPSSSSAFPSCDAIRRRQRATDSGCSSTPGTSTSDDEKSYTSATTDTFVDSEVTPMGTMKSVLLKQMTTQDEESHDSALSLSVSGESSSSGPKGSHLSATNEKKNCIYSPFDRPRFESFSRGQPPPNADAVPMTAISTLAMLAAQRNTSTQKSCLQKLFNRLRRPLFHAKVSRMPFYLREKRLINDLQSASTIEYECVDNLSQLSGIEDLGKPWINIRYHEHGDVLSTRYQSSAAEVSVTGFSEVTTAARFALGTIVRPRRSCAVYQTRSIIREGIRFYYQNGDVYLDCIGPEQIFIQSPLYAYCHQHPLSTVYRLCSGNAMLVFSAASFEQLLTEAERRGNDAVISLEHLCILRISFMEGWGENFCDSTIVGLPVWLEVHFLYPLADIDRIVANFHKKAVEARRAARLKQQSQESAEQQQQQQQQQQYLPQQSPNLTT